MATYVRRSLFGRTLPHAPARPRTLEQTRLGTPSPHAVACPKEKEERRRGDCRPGDARTSFPGMGSMGPEKQGPATLAPPANLRSPVAAMAPRPQPGAPIPAGAGPLDPDPLNPLLPLTSCRSHLQWPPLLGPSLPAGVSLSDLISGPGRRGGAVAEGEGLATREGPPLPSASGPWPRPLPSHGRRGLGEAGTGTGGPRGAGTKGGRGKG